MMRGALRRVAAGLRAVMRPSPAPGRIVAICHCHYPELVAELAVTLRRLPQTCSLHVSSSRPAVLDVWAGLRSLPSQPVLHRVENRGRDIRPFFDIAQGLRIDPDDLVLKIHGKRSDYSEQGGTWRGDLLRGLVPDRSTSGLVAERFRGHARLGLLGAPGSYIGHPVYWGENRSRVAQTMTGMFGAPPIEEDLGFFAGSMFWIRGALLLELLAHIDLDAFEPEPLPQDGSYAHAVERIIGMAARRWGWDAAEVGSATIIDGETARCRKIPYI